FFKSPQCYEPIISQCKGELVYATKAFKARQRHICGDRFARKGTDNFSDCTAHIEPHSQRCREKRSQRMEKVAHMAKTASSSHPWCNVTDDYITCVYSVMALACTMEEAEEYMTNLKQMKPVVDAIYGYDCTFGHPLNILKTTTAVPDTTQDLYGESGRGVVYRSGHHPSMGSRRSSGSSLHNYNSDSYPGTNAKPNRCNTFFEHKENKSFSFLSEKLGFPGQEMIVFCYVLTLFIKTFLVRDSCLSFWYGRHQIQMEQNDSYNQNTVDMTLYQR
ncbi:hypothetical protein PoB_002541600, partial [Plakobranchus ocellatus]